MDVILATLNARYAHAAFGLRYLLANLPEALIPRAQILEFDINQRPIDIVEKILRENPKIVGLGIYIWNVEQSTQVAAQLKRLRPEITLILGGPEVSYETDLQEICRLADYVICGEADIAFGELCEQLLSGRRPLMRVMQATLPEFGNKGSGFGVQGSVKSASARIDSASLSVPEPRSLNSEPSSQPSLRLPYHLYSEHDLSHRVVYVEASRGCPFKCEFCLSALDVPVRNAPIDSFLAEMQKLLDRGLKQFKFVDRTFNLNLSISRSILEFFLQRYQPGMFLHFEMIPDRLPEALRELIARFPPGALQFEVGIQTFNPEVEKLISRRQDHARLEDNLRWLREHTGVHIHTDLIVGLPGEDLESFGRGFDKLVSLRPQEIQVGILKRLRGTPIVRHDVEWEMVYSPHAPYEILQTKLIDFPTMQRMRRFARYWDLVANSGNFVEATERLLQPGMKDEGGWMNEQTVHPSSFILHPSPFLNFLSFSDWLYATTAQTHSISLTNLAELIFRFCTTQQRQEAKTVAQSIWNDFKRVGRSDRPDFLQPYVPAADTREMPGRARQRAPSRQARHLGA